jgi:hypothetical protein
LAGFKASALRRLIGRLVGEPVERLGILPTAEGHSLNDLFAFIELE